ncbi:acyl-CoA dehydrogenase family protein [Cupriavidus metallidurans]|uniref:Acyl-CoA dehydrogenase, short-chain specific n=1 Tax=Cupriavidus metallidurans (strain ATCC 43123 / DSM 2839 / NBRC 102507 / CH34) TaxID=266264 RepID=Q1LMD3_CUPMC|nr:acyl-CoA dehydrogenase family protein [Cupriavidus metallidurans]ABF08693.1 acyl-CoA dehydrogenase, short-chain specific [Cupriavidus metallidurans CH34]QGS30382.1 acyl-CoA dehydrogenase [Cupriavidus metallidurans]
MMAMGTNIAELRGKVRQFVEQHAIPSEDPVLAHDVQRLDVVVRRLQGLAREAGIYAPHLPPEHGGLGLDWQARAEILEEAGRSFLGAPALNCAPPDQPNMINLMRHGNAAQQARYLQPLVQGRIRSCFAMTEPAPGAGSDPSMLRTTATRQDGKWVINGHKWFISGAVDAAFAIVLARTDEAAGTGATMFIVDTDNPGYRLVRNIAGMDGYQVGGHGEIVFEQCVVDDDAVLGQVGQGFAYAQARLEPARLSHCMRFIGRASRAMEIAQQYAAQRESFGQRLADLQQVQAMVADSHIDLHASRLMVRDCARKMDAGESVKHDSAMTKIFVSEAVWRVADRAVQIMGALGISDDTPVSMIQRELRPFRIYDGASELHRATLARRIFQHGLRP